MPAAVSTQSTRAHTGWVAVISVNTPGAIRSTVDPVRTIGARLAIPLVAAVAHTACAVGASD
jgi:hypothetical protein